MIDHYHLPLLSFAITNHDLLSLIIIYHLWLLSITTFHYLSLPQYHLLPLATITFCYWPLSTNTTTINYHLLPLTIVDHFLTPLPILTMPITVFHHWAPLPPPSTMTSCHWPLSTIIHNYFLPLTTFQHHYHYWLFAHYHFFPLTTIQHQTIVN